MVTFKTPQIIQLRREDMEKMRCDVQARDPEEACGLLAGWFNGDIIQVLEVLPIENILHSPTRFRLNPQEQLAAFNWIDSHGLEMAGIYHSHPQGQTEPSATDVDEAHYPEVAHLIWANQPTRWQCRAFFIQSGQIAPLKIVFFYPHSNGLYVIGL